MNYFSQTPITNRLLQYLIKVTLSYTQYPVRTAQ